MADTDSIMTILDEIYGFDAPTNFITDNVDYNTTLEEILKIPLDRMLYELKYFMIYVIYQSENLVDVLNEYVTSCEKYEYDFEEYIKFNNIYYKYNASVINPIGFRVDLLVQLLKYKCYHAQKNYQTILDKVNLFYKLKNDEMSFKLSYDNKLPLKKLWRIMINDNIEVKKEIIRDRHKYFMDIPIFV